MSCRWFPTLLTVLAALPLLVCAKEPALVAIIIDDMGYNPVLAQRALALPGPVTYAILPRLAQSAELAQQAHKNHRDVLLHTPMQPVGDQQMGPGGLTVDMDAQQITTVLTGNLSTVPHVIGISNHMGSRFTSDYDAMKRFMSSMQQHPGLFFLDSLTTPDSQIRGAAAGANVRVISRDVFLDNDRNPERIAEQFDQLLQIASRRGRALAIAHPYPETLEFLEQRLHALKTGPVRLVPLSLLLRSAQEK